MGDPFLESLILSDEADGMVAIHASHQVATVRVAPTTTADANTIVDAFETCGCVKLNDPGFAFDGSFVKPGVADELEHLVDLRERLSDERGKPPLSIFGHADPVGNDSYNKILSGRRAQAVYAMLVRDTSLWEELYSHPFGGDQWGVEQTKTMLEKVGHSPGSVDGELDTLTIEAVGSFQREKGLTPDGVAGPATRKSLFLAYMDALCGADLKLDRVSDFLARGADPHGKGDLQGCGEFNPLLLFSQQENQEFSHPDSKSQRDEENQPNRRVLIFLFRPGDRVSLERWPCPRAQEDAVGCRKRFFLDADRRRAFQEKRRKYEESSDTFACRFYQLRIAEQSPCEAVGDGQRDAEARGDGEENDQFDVSDGQVGDSALSSGTLASGSSSSSSFINAKSGFPVKSRPVPAHATQSPQSDPAVAALTPLLVFGGFPSVDYDDSKGFVDANLDHVLAVYTQFWFDRNGNPIADHHDTTGGNGFQLPATGGGGGDSAGKAVAEFPAWVKLFQNRLIATDVSEFRGPLKLDMQATQRLIQAYLNSFNRKTGTNFHSSLEEFYFHVGKSETNGQAIALGGARGNDDWCAGASYRALVRGLYRHGLQFKVPPKRKPPTVKKVYDIVGQSLALVRWMEQKGNTTRLGPGDATAVQPGDIITLVSGGMDGPLSGHVATVVKESGGVIYIVSGNAAGTGVGWGSVRVEQVKRETIPPGYDYERIAKHSNDYAIEKKEYKRLLKEWNALEPELKQPGLDPAKIDDIMARSRATREKWDASKGRKDDIRKKAAKEGLPVERMDLDNFTPDPLFALGTHAPAAPDTSWVVKISHTSKLDASSGRLQDPAIESGTPLDQMPDGDPEFSPS